jgi:hypothetical protein
MFHKGAGEAAGWTMVLAHACSAAGTPNLIALGFGYSTHNFIIDTPVKEVLFVYELYVNFFSRRLQFFVCDHIVYYLMEPGEA